MIACPPHRLFVVENERALLTLDKIPSFSWRHNHLHVQRDLDFVPDHETSIVECWAVRKTEILTVDFCGSGYRSPLQSPRILDRRFRLGHVQHNGFRHSMNRKIASNFEMSRPLSRPSSI